MSDRRSRVRVLSNVRSGLPLVGLLFSLLGGTACFPLDDSCDYNGHTYAKGEMFRGQCNNACSCSGNGVISCTNIGCIEDGGRPVIDAQPDVLVPPARDGGATDAPDAPPDIDAPPAVDGRPDVPPEAPPSADAGGVCQADGHTYAPHVLFPSNDGCNLCSCQPEGNITCTARLCYAPDSGLVDIGCSFDRIYHFRDDGGRRAFIDSSTLELPNRLTVARDHLRNALPNLCSNDVACVVPSGAGVVGIMQAMAHPDVVAALAMATPPFYGTDPRPSDGTVFIFERDDHRGFTIGAGDVPNGLHALADLLHRLYFNAVDSPACAGL